MHQGRGALRSCVCEDGLPQRKTPVVLVRLIPVHGDVAA